MTIEYQIKSKALLDLFQAFALGRISRAEMDALESGWNAWEAGTLDDNQLLAIRNILAP